MLIVCKKPSPAGMIHAQYGEGWDDWENGDRATYQLLSLMNGKM